MENVLSKEAATPKKARFSLRTGQWLRLAAVVCALVAIVLYLTLPQITVAYQKYSNTSTAGARDYDFPQELISGLSNFFGGGYFALYTKSDQGAEVLVSQQSAFNGFALGCVLIALIACGLDLWLNFTRKNEKWSKLTTLLFVISGLMAIMGPIWFLAVNKIGGADWTTATDLLNYWKYDSLYVHDAYGALVSGGVFILGAICFATGTGLEGGDRNDTRNQD
ncbi:MAG: hypothetical protein LKK13_01260 [Bacilli bacterium]|jgi:hypothetical protein|nr:hypothetical protein [Bacilli bacterium]